MGMKNIKEISNLVRVVSYLQSFMSTTTLFHLIHKEPVLTARRLDLATLGWFWETELKQKEGNVKAKQTLCGSGIGTFKLDNSIGFRCETGDRNVQLTVGSELDRHTEVKVFSATCNLPAAGNSVHAVELVYSLSA